MEGDKMGCPTNAQIRRGANDFYDDHIDEYDEAKATAFLEHLADQADGLELYEMDVDWYQGVLDTFTFKDESDWLADEYESFIGEMDDRCYDEARDAEFDRD